MIQTPIYTYMTHARKIALALCLAAMANLLRAQDGKGNSFSLQQAVDYALKNSPNIKNAELDLQNAEYRKREISGIGMPQVKASFDVKNYLEIPTSLIPAQAFNPAAPSDAFMAVKFGTKYNSTAGVSASQLIFSSDYIFGLRAAKQFMDFSAINTKRSRAELTEQVSKAYYMVLISRDKIQLIEAGLERLKKALNDTRAANQQGFTELIDVDRLEVQYNNLVTEKENTLKLISLSELALKFQMGYNLNDAIELTDKLDASLTDFQDLSASGINVSRRPEMELLKAQQGLLELDLNRLKWGYLPTVAAYGAYNFNRQGNKLDLFTNDATNPTKQWYKVALIGVTMDISIFDGLQRHNKIQQAKISYQKNQNDLRNLEFGAQLEATKAVITYNNSYSGLQIQKKNLELARRVADVTQKKFSTGVGTNLEVVNAEAALKEAQTNYYNAVYEMLVAKIDYQKATGTLVK